LLHHKNTDFTENFPQNIDEQYFRFTYRNSCTRGRFKLGQILALVPQSRTCETRIVFAFRSERNRTCLLHQKNVFYKRNDGENVCFYRIDTINLSFVHILQQCKPTIVHISFFSNAMSRNAINTQDTMLKNAQTSSSTLVEARLIEIFKEVTVIPAMSGTERNMADYIHAFMRRIGITCHEDTTNTLWGGDAGNLHCTIGTGGDFIMSAHMDTPRPTKDTVVVIDDEKITSDGTTALGVDNRVGVTLLLYTLEKAMQEQIPLKDATVVFTTCEETTLGGSTNIPLGDAIKMGFVFDSSLRPGNFVRESCGAIAFTARILGKAAHSGIAPEKGIHALRAAATAVSRMKMGRIDETTTVNVGMMHGGEGVNVIPALAVVEGEVRSMDWGKIEALTAEVRETFELACAEHGATLDFQSRWDFAPYNIGEQEPVFQQISRAIAKAGLKPVAHVSWGGSDANSFNQRGIRSVNIGIGAQNPHANTEFIYLEDFQKAADIALEVLRKA
jgi:tripeptide aminopeptidase